MALRDRPRHRRRRREWLSNGDRDLSGYERPLRGFVETAVRQSGRAHGPGCCGPDQPRSDREEDSPQW